MRSSARFFRRSPRALAVGACTLVLPIALVFSVLGFRLAHGAGASSTRGLAPETSLVGVIGATEICDGRSLCFEFATAGDGPLWVLIQNRANRADRGVLIARTAGFEDSHTLRAGSATERRLLAALQDLADHEGEDVRVRGNLERLRDLITNRQSPSPALTDWYLH